jgi:outer membrane protein assembly factor BamB
MNHTIEKCKRRARAACAVLLLLCASLSAQPNTSHRRWMFPIGATVVQSPAIGSDGTIYIGTGMFYDYTPVDTLYAIRPDGTPKWKRNVGRAVHSSVALDEEDNLYFLAGNFETDDRMDAVILSYDSSGNFRWMSEHIGWMYPQPFTGFTPAIASDGTVYACGRYSLFALNKDGTKRWSYDFPLRDMTNWQTGQIEEVGDHYSAPTLGPDGTLYVNNWSGGHGPNEYVQGGVYAINPDGTLKWRTHDAGGTAAPVIGADGTIYSAISSYQDSDTPKLLAINPEDGTLKWSVETVLYIQASPSIGPDGTVYAATSHHPMDVPAWIYAITPEGQIKWKYDTYDDVKDLPPAQQNPPDIYNSPAIDSNGLIYFGNEIGLFYAMSPDGEVVWIDNDIWSLHDQGPALARDGTLYVATHSPLGLIAFNTGSRGLADSPWPKFRRNNANTGNAVAPEPTSSVRNFGTSIAFELVGNYPNPFNPETTIEYRLPASEFVQMCILDLEGRRVTELVNGWIRAGRQQVRWNGTDDRGQAVPTGVYVCRMHATAGGSVLQKTWKLCLVR